MLTQLIIIGVLVACLPLSLVWASSDSRKYRKLIWITVFFTVDLILFGAFTRLTDSGLGCPDWPGCYSQANPFQAHAEIRAAELAMPTGPVTQTKAWIEMIHRYLAMGLGVLITALMLISWRGWIRHRSEKIIPALASREIIREQSDHATTDNSEKIHAEQNGHCGPLLPTVLFLLVCLIGAFGRWTVTLKLQPIVVTTHLVLAMILLALMVWLGARQDGRVLGAFPDPALSALRMPAAMAMALLMVQIALGGWVSTNYAALACTDFPLCHGVLFPDMDFGNGYSLWRDLGKSVNGEHLQFSALTAIHWTHRMFAFLVVIVVATTAYRARKIDALRKLGGWLFVAIAVQFLTGMMTIFLKWPLALAVMHNGGAAILVIILTMLNYRVSTPASAPRQIY